MEEQVGDFLKQLAAKLELILLIPTLGVSHIMAVTGLNIFTQFTASSCKCDVSAPRFLRKVQHSINLSLIHLMQSGSRNSEAHLVFSDK